MAQGEAPTGGQPEETLAPPPDRLHGAPVALEVDLDSPERQRAEAVVQRWSAALPAAPEQQACVADQLAVRPEVLGEIEAEEPQRSVPDGSLSDLMWVCQQVVVFGPSIVDAVAGPGEETPTHRRECILTSFIEGGDELSDTFLSGAMTDDGAGSAIEDLLSEMRERCS